MNTVVITNIVFKLTNDCNINCPYCFQKNKDKRAIEFDNVKEATDFLIRQAKTTKELDISFFGGEPLLMFDMITKAIAYSEKQAVKYNKQFKYSITTNGTLFDDEIVDFFWKKRINIIFSWDGDKRRIIKVKGINTYKKIFDSVTKLSGKGYKLTARVTVDPNDLRLIDFANHLNEVGFAGMVLVPMSGTNEWKQYETDKAYMDFANFFIKKAEEGHMVNEQFITQEIMYRLGLWAIPDNPCGAGKELYGITVDGKILPCQHEETWIKDFTLGNVLDKEINESILKPFSSFSRKNNTFCRDCFAIDECLGICLSHNYDDNKNIFQPSIGDCIWVKARYKAVDHIINKLYVKRKNLNFIRWVLKTYIGWKDFYCERIIRIPNIDRTMRDAMEISFALLPDDLNLKTGKKISSFLKEIKENNNFKIIKPIPPCLFNSEREIIFEKYKIPKNMIYDSIHEENISKSEIPSGANKTAKVIFDYYKANAVLPIKCKNCVLRIRNKCDYCYFGIEM